MMVRNSPEHLIGKAVCVAVACSLMLPCAQSVAQQQDIPPSPTNGISKPDAAAAATKNGGATAKPKPQQSDTKPASSSQPKGNGNAPAKTGGSTQPNEAAVGGEMRLGPTSPAPTPPGPTGRRRIGLALGGGGALAMSEIGVLQWFEEHHIPVDELAGTSMGALVGSLYATGHSIDQMKHVMTENVFSSVFRINTAYKSRSFRRREDDRELPNAIGVGLKHGVSFRNAVLTDNGLDALLDREFLRYDDRTDFNTLPIPFRCVSTDITDAKSVVFARGSLPNAVRASVSIPGIYRPFSMNGHEFVDGAVLQNLPTHVVQDDMKADVILAVSLPLLPAGQSDLSSIIGVLQRAFSVSIEGNERLSRKTADVLIMPDLKGFNESDYLKTKDLSARGYQAAEAMKAQLLPYAVSDAEWQQYLAHRASRDRGPAGSVLTVRIKAPSTSAQQAVERMFQPLVNQPVDTGKIESLLDRVRADGRYDADYTVGYSEKEEDRPTILVTVVDKPIGPPYLLAGANIAAQTPGITQATFESRLIYQDFGGYGSELGADIRLGYMTDISGEYYRKIGKNGFFVAPTGSLLRKPYYIFSNDNRISERQLQLAGGGADAGWGNGRTMELRAGWRADDVRWTTVTGSGVDTLGDYLQHRQLARAQFIFDTQDGAQVPQYGIRSQTDIGYLYDTPGSRTAPQLFERLTVSHTFARRNVFIVSGEGATMFNRDVAQPFRYTLGGPFRLGASDLDQYRGTDYFLVQPAYLRRIAKLPAVLGQSIYVGAMYEAGQMRAPDASTVTRQDFNFGIVAETPLGAITIAPSIDTNGNSKFVFTLGKLF
jgi:NTE family protein